MDRPTPAEGQLWSNASCQVPYEEPGVALVALYSVVVVVGVPANLLTLCITWRQVYRHGNVLAVYLLGLALSDLTYLCTLPLWALYVSRGRRWQGGALSCRVTGFVFFTNMYVSVFLLCCVSCDRYLATVHALRSRSLRRRHRAVIVTVAIMLVVALGHMPVFTMREGLAADGHCFEPGQNSATVTGFNCARVAVGFLAPLALLAGTNRAILAAVRSSAAIPDAQKARVRALALGVVVLFLVCFGPYHLILLLRAFSYFCPLLAGRCLFEEKIYTPYTVSLCLATLNSALNPLLYVLSSGEARSALCWGPAPFRTNTPFGTNTDLTTRRDAGAAEG